jgi:hypothetical protein
MPGLWRLVAFYTMQWSWGVMLSSTFPGTLDFSRQFVGRRNSYALGF